MIDSDILLKKIRAISFSYHTIDCFKSYISNRLFRVNLENSWSDPPNTACGLPQGLILGLLLFLIYMNGKRQSVKPNLYMLTVLALFLRERTLKKLNGNLN